MPREDDPYLRKQPRQSRSRALVDAVLEATDHLLAKSGVEALSVQSIARRAGVGIGSVYDYFANADGVWGAFVRRLTQGNFDALRAYVERTEGRPFLDALPGIIDEAFRVYLESPARTRAVVNAVSRLGLARFVVEERDRFAALLADRIVKEWPALDPLRVREEAELLCDAAMGVVITELWRPRDAAARERVLASLKAMVVERVSALRDSRP